MIRILYIIPTLDPSGSEKQLALLATHLPRQEFAVEVCALTRGGPYAETLASAGIRVSVLGKRLKADPVAAWKLSQLIRRGRFDIVHTWLFAANSYGRLVARRHGVPVLIASERCADHWKGAMERSVDRWLAPRTDRIVVNAQAVAHFYEAMGIDPSKLVVIPNGIALDAPPAVDRAALLRELDVPADARVLGFVGRLWPQKRVRDFLWATEVLRNIDNVYAVVAGDGPQRDWLMDYTRAIGIEKRVRFLGIRSDVPRLLAGMDILVLPSEFEGMPNAVLEAMAAGLPVIATQIPGTDEVVVHGETGFLVPVGDTAAIARSAHRLLEDEALRVRMGQAGLRRVRDCFSVEKMVESYLALYREVCLEKQLSRSSMLNSPLS